MKVVLGNLQMELTCDEFKEIYPAISNGKAVIESTEVAPLKSKAAVEEKGKSPYREGSYPAQILALRSKMPKDFTAMDLIAKGIPSTEKGLHVILSRLAKAGHIKRTSKGHYTFFKSDLEDAEPESNSIQRIREEPSEWMSEEMVLEMWHHVKSLFEEGKPVPDTQIAKMFGKLSMQVVAKWIVQACDAGLIEQDIGYSGFYKIVRTELVQGKGKDDQSKKRMLDFQRLKRVAPEEYEHLKEKILGVMRSESSLHRWRPKHIAARIGLQKHRLYTVLTELVEEGKIQRCHYGNGMNPNRQKLYYSLEIGEPEPAPAPTVLNEQAVLQKESASLV